MAESTNIYLDYAATTPLCEEAAIAMQPYFAPASIGFSGNANALYEPGREAFKVMEQCRTKIARFLGVRIPTDIAFTSGATESNNLAILGIVSACVSERKLRGDKGFVPHIIISAIEHPSVYNCAELLKRLGCAVTKLPVDRGGFVSAETLQAAITPSTVLVSVQFVNNEIGTVQPIRELAAIAHQHKAYFHTDATQALGHVVFSLSELDVDAASFSSHKVYGPKGIGLLYVKTRTPYQSFMSGGGQESKKRSGTQNIPGIVGFCAALDVYASKPALLETEIMALSGLRDYLYHELAAIPSVKPSVNPSVNPSVCCDGGSQAFAPHIVNVCVCGIESQTLIMSLEKRGFYVSGGSACSSNSLDPSHVLSAIGLQRDIAQCSLRISLGRYTTKSDVSLLVEAVRKVVSDGR